jgi:transposase
VAKKGGINKFRTRPEIVTPTRIEQLLEIIYGKKSEKSKEEQKPNQSENQTSENGQKQKRTKNGGGGRTAIPKGMRHETQEIHPPETERICSCCGKPFKLIGFDKSTQIIFTPADLHALDQLLAKYMPDCDCSERRSVTAESPMKPIDKGLASTSLVSAIAVMKFADHLPLARQAEHIFKRSGFELSQSSMCRWMRNIADLLEPLYHLIRVRGRFCIQS